MRPVPAATSSGRYFSVKALLLLVYLVATSRAASPPTVSMSGAVINEPFYESLYALCEMQHRHVWPYHRTDLKICWPVFLLAMLAPQIAADTASCSSAT